MPIQYWQIQLIHPQPQVRRLTKAKDIPISLGAQVQTYVNKNKVVRKLKRKCNLDDMSCMFLKRKWDLCPKLRLNFLL